MIDRSLKRRVFDELAWEPSLDETCVGPIARDGVITLTGFVWSYTEKCIAEAAASHVLGVKAIVNDILVRPASGPAISDDDMTRRANATLAWDVRIPKDRIAVSVNEGWLTLSGHVDWQFQWQIAEIGICRMSGVMGVINHILVKPNRPIVGVDSDIRSAFSRNTEFNAENIVVTTDGSSVTLTGQVRSYRGRTLAADTVWSAPGVTEVHELLTIG